MATPCGLSPLPLTRSRSAAPEVRLAGVPLTRSKSDRARLQKELAAKEASARQEAAALQSELAKLRKELLAVETAAFVVAQLVTPSSPGGSLWLRAAPHTPEEPPSHWVCFQ